MIGSRRVSVLRDGLGRANEQFAHLIDPAGVLLGRLGLQPQRQQPVTEPVEQLARETLAARIGCAHAGPRDLGNGTAPWRRGLRQR